MSVQVFLGEPPANIKKWIIEHYAPPTPAAGPLCFTAEQDGSSVSLIGWDDDMYNQIDIFASLQYSYDNNTWQEWDGHVINLAAGQKVYVKALNPNPNGMAKNDGVQYHKFIFEGKIAASGSIQYLLEDTGSRTDVPTYAYYYMFYGCTNLTQAPALPATTLANNCYYYMFANCTSLTSAPELPATTLANGCYKSMFSGCTSLSSIKVAFTAWLDGNATTIWLNNVAASGTFTCPQTLIDNTTERGSSTVPESWTMVAV